MARRRYTEQADVHGLAQQVLMPGVLRARRVALGLTQAGLAPCLGVTANTLARWERGELRPAHPQQLARRLACLERAPAGRPRQMASAGDALQQQHLPAELSPLIGRGQEIAEVQRRLASARLLTLVGVGGVGKTRLALHVAIEVASQYTDGVSVVALGSVADPALVAHAVAASLGMREPTDRPMLDALVEVLRSRRALLLLDNCEHVVSACAELARHLLESCPGLRILATSRQPLGVAGEWCWQVPPLTLPGSTAVQLPCFAECPAVELFVERASSARSSFTLTDQNAASVAEVCRRLDGLPLAIELAAARTAVLSIDQLLQRLDDRLGLLTNGPRTAPARQQALRATLDWSWELLSAPEQILLRRLAVFAGGWPHEAASTVCGDDQLPPDGLPAVLWGLVASSLVVAEECAGAMRYRLLELVRAYAWEQLQAAGEAGVLRARHRAWCLALVERGRGPWPAGWARAVERELSNVRAALDWSETEQGAGGAGLQLATALRGLWVRGRRREGRDHLVRLLQRAPASASGLLARALALAGHLSAMLGDDAAAETLVSQSLDLWRRLGDAHGLADALCDAGSAAHLRRDHVGAASLLRECLTLAEAFRNTYRQCQALLLLGAVLRSLGELDEAAATFERGLALARTHDDVESTALLLLESANLAVLRGDPVHATALSKDSLRYWRQFDSAHGLARSIEVLGRAASASGQATRAARLLGAAEIAREQLGVTLRPTDPEEYQRAVAAARARLGDKRFAAAWAAGRTMSLAQAVAYAVAPEEGHGARTGAHPGRAAGAEALTARERDVVRLVAHGLSNRQITERLIVSERTVAAHIEHILDKLGVSSRTQIALWAAANGQLGPERG